MCSCAWCACVYVLIESSPNDNDAPVGCVRAITSRHPAQLTPPCGGGHEAAARLQAWPQAAKMGMPAGMERAVRAGVGRGHAPLAPVPRNELCAHTAALEKVWSRALTLCPEPTCHTQTIYHTSHHIATSARRGPTVRPPTLPQCPPSHPTHVQTTTASSRVPPLQPPSSSAVRWPLGLLAQLLSCCTPRQNLVEPPPRAVPTTPWGRGWDTGMLAPHACACRITPGDTTTTTTTAMLETE